MATFKPVLRGDLAVEIQIPEGATGEDIVRLVDEQLGVTEAFDRMAAEGHLDGVLPERTLDINEITRDADGNVLDHKGNRVEK